MRGLEVQVGNPEKTCHTARNAGPLSQTMPHFAPTAARRSRRPGPPPAQEVLHPWPHNKLG
jgi:hypothetical protein